MRDAQEINQEQGSSVLGTANAEGGSDLVLSLAGFEGPIDLLLSLAREQKVDLANIAILPLAEQFLDYIATARKLRLEIAADYLVMAAWLAYLKSRLLLPEQQIVSEQQNTAEMTEALRFQLQRLEAMQRVARELQDFPQLGCDVFLKGFCEPLTVTERPKYYLPYQDLLLALGASLRRHKAQSYEVKQTRLYSLEESLERLRMLIGKVPDWSVLKRFLPKTGENEEPLERKSAMASTFVASLEMVKCGELEIRQESAFGPIYLRNRKELPNS